MDEQNASELVEEFVDRFDTEVNVLKISANSAIIEQADRYQHIIEECLEKDIPNFESLTLGFSRKVELELVNFKEAALGLEKCMREQLIHKLTNYDDEAVAEFSQRAMTIIDEEGETVRERLRSTYLEYTEEKSGPIAKSIKEFDEMTKANDNKRRLRVTAMLSPYDPDQDKKEKKSLDFVIKWKSEVFNQLFKKISDNFNTVLDTNTRLSKALIDQCIQEEFSLFMIILSNFNDELYRVIKNYKLLINITLENTLEQLNKWNDNPDAFSVAALALQQKSNMFFEGLERQLATAVASLDKYRDEERRKIICINASTRRPLEESIVYAVDAGEEILYDGRVRRRLNAVPEIDLDDYELHMDEKYRESCELNRKVILNRINDESVDVETFAVQNYQHTNLLRCLGTGRKDEFRYLVFEEFPDTLTKIMTYRSMEQDEFIQFASGLQQAVQYLHENNLFHGDLTSDNVYFELTDDYNKVKLAHFSMLSAREAVQMESAEQTPFSAPEAGPIVSLLLLQKSDIWSFGTLLWYALTGVTPAHEKIVELPSTIPENAELLSMGSLLKNCWSLNVEDRPSVFDLGIQLRNVITDIAFTFTEDEQWMEEVEKWKRAATLVEDVEMN